MPELRAAALQTLRARAELALGHEDVDAGLAELDAAVRDANRLLRWDFFSELLTVVAGLGLPPLLLCVLPGPAAWVAAAVLLGAEAFNRRSRGRMPETSRPKRLAMRIAVDTRRERATADELASINREVEALVRLDTLLDALTIPGWGLVFPATLLFALLPLVI